MASADAKTSHLTKKLNGNSNIKRECTKKQHRAPQPSRQTPQVVFDRLSPEKDKIYNIYFLTEAAQTATNTQSQLHTQQKQHYSYQS